MLKLEIKSTYTSFPIIPMQAMEGDTIFPDDPL
jgi:hypothetical protein